MSSTFSRLRKRIFAGVGVILFLTCAAIVIAQQATMNANGITVTPSNASFKVLYSYTNSNNVPVTIRFYGNASVTGQLNPQVVVVIGDVSATAPVTVSPDDPAGPSITVPAGVTLTSATVEGIASYQPITTGDRVGGTVASQAAQDAYAQASRYQNREM